MTEKKSKSKYSSKKSVKPPAKKPAKKVASLRKSKAKLRNQRAAEAYVISGGNASEAAKASGSKAKRLRQAGHEILTNPDVQDEIKQFSAECRSQAVLTGRQVLERLSEQAIFNPLKYMNQDGSLKLDDIERDNVGHLFQGFTVRTVHKLGVTITTATAVPYSHQKALGVLADCLGLKMAPKTNEFDSVCSSLRRYMEEANCTLVQALDKLGHLDVVQRHREAILERGIV